MERVNPEGRRPTMETVDLNHERSNKANIHPPIVIREAKLEDLSEVLRIYAQPELDDDETLSLEDAIECYSKFQRYPHYKLYVAVDRQSIVGTFALLIMDNLAHRGAPSGIIEDVGVLPDYQGQGIGKRMMEYAMETCKKAGCYKVSLSTNVRRQKTHGFYESLGFTIHGYSYVLDFIQDTSHR